MSNRRCFVDSNIWLYAFMQSESSKTIQAVEIISNPKVVLSTQVINDCRILYSEDMQHNQVIQNIHIINPFFETK